MVWYVGGIAIGVVLIIALISTLVRPKRSRTSSASGGSATRPAKRRKPSQHAKRRKHK